MVKKNPMSNDDPIKILEGHSDSVEALCFTPDGKILISRSLDGVLAFWHIPDGTCLEILDLQECSEVRGVCFVPGHKIVACGSHFGEIALIHIPDEIYARLLEGGRSAEDETYPMAVLDGHKDTAHCHIPHPVCALCATPDGAVLISGSHDATVRLWRLPDGEHIKTLKGHADRVEAVCISPNGDFLASASSMTDGTIRLWSLPDGKSVATIESGSVFALCYTPDGNMLASRAENGEIALWNVPNGKQINSFQGYTDPSRDLWIDLQENEGLCYDTERGYYLKSGEPFVATDHEVTVRAGSFPDYVDSSPSVCVSPDGKTLIGEGADSGTVHLWSLPDGKRIAILATQPVPSSWKAGIENLEGLTDHARRERAKRAFDSLSKEDRRAVIELLHSEKSRVRPLSLSPDGRTLAGGSDNGDIYLWRLA